MFRPGKLCKGKKKKEKLFQNNRRFRKKKTAVHRMSEARGNDSTYCSKTGAGNMMINSIFRFVYFLFVVFFFLNLALITGDRFAQQHMNSL